MLNAVAASGIAEWGGDSAVLDAATWLEPSTALTIAEAFRNLIALRQGNLRLKVQRAVYSWGESPNVYEICDDLGLAFRREHIFIDWPSDRRPRHEPPDLLMGLSIATVPDLREATTPLVESLPNATWRPLGEPAIITVATLIDLPQLAAQTQLLIILDASHRSILSHIDAVRKATGAKCAIFLPGAQPYISRWLKVFGKRIASKYALDWAMADANREVANPAFILAANQSFILQSPQVFFPRLPRERLQLERPVSENALDYSTLEPSAPRRGRRAPNFEIDGVRMDVPPPSVRLIDGRVARAGEIVDVFPTTGTVDIDISIQVMSPLKLSTPEFPEDNLTWEKEHKNLQVHLTEVGAPPRTESLLLPRSGPSTTAKFSYQLVQGHVIDIRFLICEEKCILQTARLQGSPGHPVHFFVESLNSPLERKKRSFDVSFLVNDSLGNTPSATVLTSEGIRFAELELSNVVATRDQLRRTLAECLNPSSEFSSSLFDLANSGKVLLDELRELAPGWPKNIERMQLTTPSNVHFPVELLYDGEVPVNRATPLCDQRLSCLTSGKAVENCAIRALNKMLCPMGFLGITTVIERQTWDRTMDRTYWLRKSDDLSGRSQITDLRRALFAASNRADDFEDNSVGAAFEPTRTIDIARRCNVQRKDSWQEWSKAITAMNPKLLVILPHFENNELYIGDDDALALGALTRPYIGEADPIIIAIGCNTAIGLTPNSNLPSILLRAGAKVVIASLNNVLGRFANIATSDLTHSLMTTSQANSQVTMGELLVRLRREFLAKDNALGLTLIAFGDADIYLGKQPT